MPRYILVNASHVPGVITERKTDAQHLPQGEVAVIQGMVIGMKSLVGSSDARIVDGGANPGASDRDMLGLTSAP